LIGFRSGQIDPALAKQFGSKIDAATLGQLGKAVAPPIEDAFVDAARLAGFVATGFVLLGLFFSLLLPKTKSRAETERQQAPDLVAA
jgi:hypothetical protein